MPASRLRTARFRQMGLAEEIAAVHAAARKAVLDAGGFAGQYADIDRVSAPTRITTPTSTSSWSSLRRADRDCLWVAALDS